MSRRLLLINIPLIELTRRVIKSGGVCAKGMFILITYYARFIIAIPGSCLQSLLYARKIKRTVISKSPVFILGHYRSGTTYLHKLFTGDTRFCYLSNYEMICPFTNLLFGKWLEKIIQFIINKLKIKNDFFNNSIVLLNEPCEEDRFLIAKASRFSAYWGFIFPKRAREWLNCNTPYKSAAYIRRWKREYIETLQLITFKNKGRQIISKNPPNTERIKYLLEMFPDARFVYIRRNPFHLFYSMKNIWMKGIIKHYCLQNISNEQLEELIFQHFDYLISQYERDKHLIPVHNLVEIEYEDLELKPLEVLRRIYSQLNLHDFKVAIHDFNMRLQKEKQYQKFQYEFEEDTFKRIEKRWAKHIEQWNSAATTSII